MRYPASDAPLADALARWAATGDPTGTARSTIPLAHEELRATGSRTLDAHYRFQRTDLGIALTATIDGVTVDLDAPAALEPVTIPKPWGQEIWYTGIEARGESAVRARGATLPLSHYLALAPAHLVRGRPLVLLKILDPRPEPVLGDLYFEVHREKQEVYVVTCVDSDAWPDGRGRIRLGMNQALRATYADDAAFRADYQRAVLAYEEIRRAADAGTEIMPAAEAAARANMERFTALHPLAPGDVVVVPTWLPHALQHGVRVVEFQTPTYERYILSFAQRVLTQPHWDTAYAVPRMSLAAPPEPRFDSVAPGVDRIVAFADFSVWRVTLGPGADFDLPGHPSYAVCMVVAGRVSIGTLSLTAEQAALVPGATLADPLRRRALAAVRNAGHEPATLLIAAPDL